MANVRRAARWSYVTGERGVNRVRAYDRGKRGIFLEWFEELPGGTRKRHSVSLKHHDQERAKEQADELALKFRRQDTPTRELTLARLFEIYEREVTPTKARDTQSHDRRCFGMFLRAFGKDRKPSTLSRRDWDRFIAERRAGRLVPKGTKPGRKVRDRAIQQNLQLLRAVLNWALLAGDGKGNALLDRNPLEGLDLPSEESPKRGVLSAGQYAAVRAAAAAEDMPEWALDYVIAVYETGHRSASVRQLRASDLDLDGQRVHWRGDVDKIGNDHWSPLTPEAAVALKRQQRRTGAIGDAWIFPSAFHENRPLSKHDVGSLWKQLRVAAGIPKGEGFGWHSFRRRFANDLRHIPLRDLQDLGGWKTAQTILICYQQPDEEAQRTALASRRRVAAEG